MFDRDLYSGELKLKNARFQHWAPGRADRAVTDRPVWGILYMLKGSICYRLPEPLTLQPGDVVLLPPGSSYTVVFPRGDAPAEDYLLNFSLPDGERLTRDTAPTLLLSDSAMTLSSAFRAVVDGFTADDDPFQLRALFYRCIHLLITAAPKAKEQLTLEAAAKFLCDSPEHPVAGAAKLAHMSRSLFQKRFKEVYGMPPVEYRNRSRLQTAMLLLETTDLPIKDIAARLGFCDVAYFHKSFRSATGMTPTEYRSASHYLI